ncbi:hypothetical protein GF314_17425 [bacterium]|nr:hypothetical protein [bacterium]
MPRSSRGLGRHEDLDRQLIADLVARARRSTRSRPSRRRRSRAPMRIRDQVPHRRRAHPRRTVSRTRAGFLVAATALLLAAPATALLSIDFEQPYYVHPGWQVWDFCFVEHEGLHHIFYLAVPVDDADPTNSDAIWTASSPDLIHWSEPQVAIEISDLPHENEALWAPDVVLDEETGTWWMAYTGVDEFYNQSICLARSRNLADWSKLDTNPVVQPAFPEFLYNPDLGWSECRDPYLFEQDGLWHMTVSVLRADMPGGRGAIGVATSEDLMTWSEVEVFCLNDGETPERALESSQYHEVTGGHHVFFHEWASGGVSHIGALEPGAWTFADREFIDLGIAPEVDTFDGGDTWLFSRCGPFEEPGQEAYSVVVRIDTLSWRQGAATPTVFRVDPFARDFASYSGSSCLGNPCFGDNPARRGEEPAQPVGNFYFGSQEYFRGPLSNRGAAGIDLGQTATGQLSSHPFVIEGHSIRLLVGGANQPDHCFVALRDAATDSTLRSATGHGSETMTPRWWNVTELQGREVYVHIEDSSLDGHINVDEIHETMEIITSAPAADTIPNAAVVRHGAHPNPFNPQTTVTFELARPATVEVAVYDLRGRRIWRSPVRRVEAGPGTVAWTGVDRTGRRVPGGLYVYRILADGRPAGSGKLSLVP